MIAKVLLALISCGLAHLFSPLTSVVLDTEQVLNPDYEWIVWRASLPFPTEVCSHLRWCVAVWAGRAPALPMGTVPSAALQALMPDSSATNYTLKKKNTTWAKRNLALSCIRSREQIRPARYVTDLHVSCCTCGLHLETGVWRQPQRAQLHVCT